MTAVVTLECNQEHGWHSLCARKMAGQLGWRSHANGWDYCPGCSGTSPAAHVARKGRRR